MIYVTGDTHGDLSRFETGGARRLKKNDTVIVCGDFGFLWDGSPKESGKTPEEKISDPFCGRPA